MLSSERGEIISSCINELTLVGRGGTVIALESPTVELQAIVWVKSQVLEEVKKEIHTSEQTGRRKSKEQHWGWLYKVPQEREGEDPEILIFFQRRQNLKDLKKIDFARFQDEM